MANVYVSYAWGGESERIVDALEAQLREEDITLVRDKNDLGYRGSIDEFMQEIGRGQAVVVVISDKYLRSPSCMFELTEVARHLDLRDRVFPIVLGDADIFDPAVRIDYLHHWDVKKRELSTKLRSLENQENTQGIREELDRYDVFRDEIAHLTDVLKDMNSLTPERHRNSDFSALVAALRRRLDGSGSALHPTDDVDVDVDVDELIDDADVEIDPDQVVPWHVGGLTHGERRMLTLTLPHDAGHGWVDDETLLVPIDRADIVAAAVRRCVAGDVLLTDDDDPTDLVADGSYVDLAEVDLDSRLELTRHLLAARVIALWGPEHDLHVVAEHLPVAEAILGGEVVEHDEPDDGGLVRYRLAGLSEGERFVVQDVLPHDAGHHWADDEDAALLVPPGCSDIVDAEVLRIVAGAVIDDREPFAAFADAEVRSFDHWDRGARVDLSRRLADAGVVYTWDDDRALHVVAEDWPTADRIVDRMP